MKLRLVGSVRLVKRGIEKFGYPCPIYNGVNKGEMLNWLKYYKFRNTGNIWAKLLANA